MAAGLLALVKRDPPAGEPGADPSVVQAEPPRARATRYKPAFLRKHRWIAFGVPVVIVGLLDRRTSGRIEIGVEQTALLDDRALTRRRGHSIGFVFQHHHLIVAFTALQNVMMPMLGAERFADEVLALLRQFKTWHGTTALFVTHHLALAERCDRIIEVVNGRLTCSQRQRQADRAMAAAMAELRATS